jgi:hypothetical protein
LTITQIEEIAQLMNEVCSLEIELDKIKNSDFVLKVIEGQLGLDAQHWYKAYTFIEVINGVVQAIIKSNTSLWAEWVK